MPSKSPISVLKNILFFIPFIVFWIPTALFCALKIWASGGGGPSDTTMFLIYTPFLFLLITIPLNTFALYQADTNQSVSRIYKFGVRASSLLSFILCFGLPLIVVFMMPLHIMFFAIPMGTSFLFLVAFNRESKLQIKKENRQDPLFAPNSSTSVLPNIWELIIKQDSPALQKALATGADINAPYPANGNTPLHIAVWNGYTDMVKFLLAQPGIDKNAKNLAGKTPLDLAEEKQLGEITRLLKN